MKKHFLRVITAPLPDLDGGPEGGEGEGATAKGEHPDALARRCKVLADYVVNVRLPESLRDLKLWVEPEVRAQDSRQVLDLMLYCAGQLPLKFKGPRGKGLDAGLAEELDRLAGCIEAALLSSNDIWNLGAEIINTEVDPAGEVEHLRLTSGYPVPNRGRRSKMPEILQLWARKEPLPLFTPELRPEYMESGELMVTTEPSMNSDRVRLCVKEVVSTSGEFSDETRVRPKDRLAPRWPGDDPRRWTLLAWVAKFMGTPMTLRGHAVISVDTLDPKALEVLGAVNAAQIVMRLVEFLKPILDPALVDDIVARIDEASGQEV